MSDRAKGTVRARGRRERLMAMRDKILLELRDGGGCVVVQEAEIAVDDFVVRVAGFVELMIGICASTFKMGKSAKTRGSGRGDGGQSGRRMVV